MLSHRKSFDELFFDVLVMDGIIVSIATLQHILVFPVSLIEISEILFIFFVISTVLDITNVVDDALDLLLVPRLSIQILMT